MEDEPISEIQRLIRLKRFERPPEAAVDDFLVEFQRRQRSQALTGSSRKLFFERLVTYMSSFGELKWVYAAVGTYACVMLFFLIRPSETSMGQPGGGAAAVPVGAKMEPVIEVPAFDPAKLNPRPLPTKVPEVREF